MMGIGFGLLWPGLSENAYCTASQYAWYNECMAKNKDKSKPGPEEERLKIDADWEDAAEHVAKQPPKMQDEIEAELEQKRRDNAVKRPDSSDAP